MIVDSSFLEEPRHYDICIIGSGPAGGTIANELAGSNLNVCVLESGTSKITPFANELKALNSEGIEILPYSRERVLGGTSTTWSGLTSPFDPIDFEKRNWVGFSGWPISREEMIPYYQAAADKFRFPPMELFNCDYWNEVKSQDSLQLEWQKLEKKVFLANGKPQNFSQEFIEVYSRNDTDLITDATVIRLDGSSHSSVAEKAIVGSSSGRIFSIHAKIFVLAANGVENCRLLLNSRFSYKNGLGNEYDQLGRYFMNHPKNYVGTIRMRYPLKELPTYFGFLYKSYGGYLGLRLKDEVQRRDSLLNSYIRFQPMFPWSDNEGVESLIFFIKKTDFLMKEFYRANKEKVVSLRDYAETGDDSKLQNEQKDFGDYIKMLGLIFGNMPDVAKYMYFRMRDRADPKIRAIRIRNFMEMEPDPNNRIKLSDKLDAFGSPLPSVYHQPTELDRRTMVYLHQVLAREVLRQGWGEFRSDLSLESPVWPINLDASHHMGGTRMGNNSRCSVVDSNCRIHSSPNVFVAGASVFPTSGNANPTFTIVALSIRLARFLRNQLSSKSVFVYKS